MIKPLNESLLTNRTFTLSSQRLLINYKEKPGGHNLNKVIKKHTNN